jgi:hypothetical protein
VKKPQVKWSAPGVRDRFYFVLLGMLGPYTDDMETKRLSVAECEKALRVMREFGVSISEGVKAGSVGMEWAWLTSTQPAVRESSTTGLPCNWTRHLVTRRLPAVRAGFMSADAASKLFDKNGIKCTRTLLQGYKAGILNEDEAALLMVHRNPQIQTEYGPRVVTSNRART